MSNSNLIGGSIDEAFSKGQNFKQFEIRTYEASRCLGEELTITIKRRFFKKKKVTLFVQNFSGQNFVDFQKSCPNFKGSCKVFNLKSRNSVG